MIKNIVTLGAVALLALSTTTAAFAADATVTIKGTGGGVILGGGAGTGVLTYKGMDIPFEWSNFSIGKVGITSGEASGEVNGLSFLEKFNGCYSNSNVDATLISGGFSRQLKNKGGVVINLKGKEKGVDISLSSGCAKVKMDEKALANALAQLNSKPVAANYSSSIFFDTNSNSVRESEYAKLESVITELQKTPGTEVIVTGYTDTTGSETHNQELSEQRAEAVVEELTKRAKDTKVSELPPQRVEVTGRGEVKGPANEPAQANRRVDIMIIRSNVG